MIFFVVLMIILFAPIIMSKLRIPHIIGMVLAGVVIGKYGLNILERDISFEIFGSVGLYYIMFLAGLEMDLESVKRKSRQFLIFGLLTCFVPLILTYVMSRTVLGYSHPASFLLGCIMASNTLIAYPIVSRYGLQRHPSVQLSVGSSMISLFLALVMIAALSTFLTAKGDSSFLVFFTFLLKLIVFIAGSIWLIPRLARYFLRRYSDAVMQYIFVLAVMFLSAALSVAIGLEGIFGAFLSGLILNRYIPKVSPLMNRIEFIGNAVFIPYFLIGVGMLINVRTVFTSFEVLLVVCLIAFFGTFGKALAAYFSSLLFRLEVAPGVYLANTDMINGVVMMILVTCIISTMMTEHASQQIVLTQSRDAISYPGATKSTNTPDDDEKILLCVKYKEIAPQLLSLALLMRNQRLNRGLVALNVVYDDEKSVRHREDGLRLLEQLQQQASAAEVQMQTQVRLASNIANGIKHAFREFSSSEIIMGMHVHTERNPTCDVSRWQCLQEQSLNQVSTVGWSV